mgnify:FL=1
MEYYPEIRELIYQYLQKNKEIDPVKTGDPALVGHWEFVPADLAGKAMDKDMELLFPKRK